MNILLTGSEGFIGKNLSKFLQDRAHNIIPLDINTGNDILSCNLKYDVDCVIHLAGLSGVRDSLNNPTDYWKQNVIASQRLFDNFKDKRIFYASSSTAAEPWRNPYAMSKYSMEQIAPGQAIGMRFTTVYGPGAREGMLIPRILRNEVPYVNTNHSRDFIHVDDVCSAIQNLITQSERLLPFGEVIDIGTGLSHKLTDIMDYFSIDTEKQEAGEMERLDNKADTYFLNSVGWVPQVMLKDYITKYRRTN
nr:Nucleoside-diphosphate-sugar epimerases (WcaG) [uncultured Mediterranean phage uvMED]